MRYKKSFHRLFAILILYAAAGGTLLAQTPTVTVTGAGSGRVNGDYDYLTQFNGRNCYRQPSGDQWTIYWWGSCWSIRDPSGNNPMYFNNHNTSLPPAWDWQVDANGAPAAPTLSGDVDPLPVQLSSLNASVVNNRVSLRWSTATEVNNFGFDVERQAIADCQLPMANWVKVAFVEAAGTSASPREYSFADNGLTAGRYGYRLKQIDKDGSFSYSHAVEVEVGLTAKQFRLAEAYPNPFNPATNIEFSVAAPGLVLLTVYDVLGEEVATLFNGAADVGRLYRVTWDASHVPSGIYFCKLTAGTFTQTRKMVLMR